MSNIMQHLLPEKAADLLPPMLPGEMITPSKLNALRRNQLIHLAMAFDIQVDHSAAKSELLHSMIRAEQQGKFRSKPVSNYYLLLAGKDTDVRLPQHEQDAFEAALEKAAEDEEIYAVGRKGPYKPEYPQDGRTLAVLQSEAVALGLNPHAKNAAALRRMIAEAKEKLPEQV